MTVKNTTHSTMIIKIISGLALNTRYGQKYLKEEFLLFISIADSVQSIVLLQDVLSQIQKKLKLCCSIIGQNNGTVWFWYG